MTWIGRSLLALMAAAAAVGAVGLDSVPVEAADPDPCAATGNVSAVLACKATLGLANAPGAVANFGADQAERALTQWVVDTATWVLNQLVDVIFANSSPVLTADWFRTHYADMVAVAWVVAPLFLILGVIQAII